MTLLIALEFDQPQTTSFSAWLIGLTLEQVDAEITHSKQTRGHVRQPDHASRCDFFIEQLPILQ